MNFKIRQVSIVILSFLICSASIFGQLRDDYVPIELNGEIPADFLRRIKGDIKLKYENNLRLNSMQQKQFNIATKFALREIFQNGHIYFNDPLTDYVRKVGDHILYNADLKNDVTFFVSRFNTPNATTWQDGTIIINIGLLSKLENEAQLAFALAHEVSHFIQQHPYQQYGKFLKNISTKKGTTQPFMESMDGTLSYELEADSIALKLLNDANYNYFEGSKVLSIIKGDFLKEPADFISYFATNQFEVTENLVCDPVYRNSYMKGQTRSLKSDVRHKKLIDNFGNTTFKSVSETELQLFLLSENLFQSVKAIAQFEVVEQAFKSFNYYRSSYEALLLIKKYPNNKYLHIKICENLYFLQYYQKMYLLGELFTDNKKIQDKFYADYCCFINKLNEKEMSTLISSLIKKHYQNYASDERMLIIMAKTIETAYGIDDARPYYQQYVKRFSEGEHYIFAENKL